VNCPEGSAGVVAVGSVNHDGAPSIASGAVAAGRVDATQHSAPERAFTGSVFAGQQAWGVDSVSCRIAAQAASGLTARLLRRSTEIARLVLAFINLPH
jgi:hypothetical protein